MLLIWGRFVFLHVWWPVIFNKIIRMNFCVIFFFMNELLQSKILDKIKMCLTIVLGVNKLRDRKTERREREILVVYIVQWTFFTEFVGREIREFFGRMCNFFKIFLSKIIVLKLVAFEWLQGKFCLWEDRSWSGSPWHDLNLQKVVK